MRTSKGLQLAMRLLGGHKNAKMIAMEAADLLKLREDGAKLKEEDIFILGLVYSEFFADGNDDQAYTLASTKRDEYLKLLGIEYKDIYNETEKIYGRNNFI